ncbi:MAG: hypothetical protein HRU20_12470 [Pseudomonadales bacterium]|nr:hypothetical protein [Pseudomonadales bacterium]
MPAQLQVIKSPQEYIDACMALVEGSSRYICIRSSLLDKSLFDQSPVVEALSSFARKSRYCEIHILIDYPDRTMNMGHGLLELSRRLSQKIIIKEYGDDKDAQQESYILGDTKSLLIKPMQQEKEGFFSLDNRPAAQGLKDEFEHAWLHSKVATQIRPLSI